jgi:hypothetical protein
MTPRPHCYGLSLKVPHTCNDWLQSAITSAPGFADRYLLERRPEADA